MDSNQEMLDLATRKIREGYTMAFHHLALSVDDQKKIAHYSPAPTYLKKLAEGIKEQCYRDVQDSWYHVNITQAVDLVLDTMLDNLRKEEAGENAEND